jgi:hypothetical protein
MPRGEILPLLLFTPLEKPWLVINEKRQIRMFARMRIGKLRYYVITAVCSQDNIISVSSWKIRKKRRCQPHMARGKRSLGSNSAYTLLCHSRAHLCCRGEDT